MAIFGAQGLVTIIVMTFLQKIAKFYSLGRYILLDLVYYLHPSDEELKKAAGFAHGKEKNKDNKDRNKGNVRWRSKQHKENSEGPEPFNIPRSTEVILDTGKMNAADLSILRFFPEFEWLVNFGFGALVVYAATEIYVAVGQMKPEFNLSMIWLLMTIAFCLQSLFSMVRLYFQTDDDGERAIVIVFGFSFFLMAMVVLIIDENLLELGLEPAYSDFAASAKQFLESQDMDGSSYISKMTFKMLLALSAALFGALLTWPGIRLAKMHREALRYEKERPAMKLLTHLNLFFPLLIAALWVKPVFRDVLVGGRFFRRKVSLLTDSSFDSLRLYAVIVFSLLRLFLIRRYLQSYLNSAYHRSQSLKKEAGKILNTDYQKIIARVYYYMVVVALQYVIPVVMLLCFTFLFKTQGNLKWGIHQPTGNVTGAVLSNATTLSSPSTAVNNTTTAALTNASEILEEFDSPPPPPPSSSDSPSSASSSSSYSSGTGADPTGHDVVSEKVTQLTSTFLSLAPVFGPVFMRGVLAFAVWWTAFVMIVTSGFGVIYYEYFAISMTGA